LKEIRIVSTTISQYMDSINSRGVLGSAGCSCSSQQVIFTVDVAAAAAAA